MFYFRIISNKSLKAENLKKKLLSITPKDWIEDEKKAQYLFVIGGDGTFLRSKEFFKNKKVICINGGNLGYYAFFNFQNIRSIFKMIIKENYYFKPLIVVAKTLNFQYQALNEILIRSNKVLDTSIYLNRVKLERFKGTGLMLSTPYGSTAHSKNCRGAIIDPEQKLMQLIEIEPLTQKKYYSLQSPLILCNNWKINLKSKIDNNANIIVDGTPVVELYEKKLELFSQEADFALFKPDSHRSYIKKLRNSFVRD